MNRTIKRGIGCLPCYPSCRNYAVTDYRHKLKQFILQDAKIILVNKANLQMVFTSTYNKPYSAPIGANIAIYSCVLRTKEKWKACHSCEKYHIHTSRKLKIPDPYEVLGVPKSATLEQIKKKFRENAKKYHPDLNPNNKDAQAKMAAVTAAYELLSNPEQRKFYDKTGMSMEEAGAADPSSSDGNPFGAFASAFGGGTTASFMFTDFAEMFSRMTGGSSFTGSGATATSSTRGDDIQSEIEVDLIDAIHGCEKVLRIDSKVRCPECKGTGCTVGTSVAKCRECRGTGVQRIDRGPIVVGIPCSTCNGSGSYIPHPCKTCKGSGVTTERKTLTLDIPAGVREGMELRVANAGHMGNRGGKSGHLFVTVHIKPDRIFTWVDDDIHVTVDLSIKQCLLGDTIEVPSLEGTMKVYIPPNTSPNATKTIKGKGPPKVNSRNGNGNLVLRFTLALPEKLTAKQMELIEEFDQIEKNKRMEYEMHDTASRPPPPYL